MDEISDYDLAIIRSRNAADKKERFDNLRLHFTTLFLRHPDMLTHFTYREIVKKAVEFTKEYLKYE